MSADAETVVEVLNRQFLLDYPGLAAKRLESLPPREAAQILSQQPTLVLLRVWRYLAPEAADELLVLLDEPVLGAFLAELDPGVCALQLNRLDPGERERCLGLLPEGVVEEFHRLTSYPVGSAGRAMDPRVMSFGPEQTVTDVLARLRKRQPRGIRQIFLVDEEQRLLSAVDIQDIALADGKAELGKLARPVRATVSPFDPREEVADRLTRFNLEVLPVTDVNDRLIGVIRHEALIKALQEETATDIQTMVGVSPDERALSSPWFAVRKRLPWMEINLATAFLAASVVGLFEDTIAKFTALAVLLPVVAGQSGNAGAQAQAVTMRGLALREITMRNWLRVTLKEISVGVMNGIAIALTTAVGVYIWSRSLGLALVISIAMVISMIAAGIAGAVIPITLTRLGQDPAQSSSIILTTVTDVAGFMSFLGIATLLAALL